MSRKWATLIISGFLLLTGCPEPKKAADRDFPDAPNELFLLNSLAETLSVLNPDSGEYHHNVITLGIWPNDIKHFEDKLYVLNSGSNSVQVFSESSFELMDEIYLGAGRNPYKMIVDDQARGWITNYVKGTLSVMNLDTLALDETEITVGAGPEGGCYLNGRIFICNSGISQSDGSFSNCSISIIDSSSKSLIETIPLDDNSNPQSALAIPVLNQVHIYLTGLQVEDDGEILVLDVPADTSAGVSIIGNYAIGGDPSYAGSAVDETTQQVYLAGQGGIMSYNYSTMEMINDSTTLLYPSEADYSVLLGGVVLYQNYLYITDLNNDRLIIISRDYKGDESQIEEFSADDGILVPLLVEE